MAHDDQKYPQTGGVSAFGSLAREVLGQITARQARTTETGANPEIGAALEHEILAHRPFHAADTLDQMRDLGVTSDALVDTWIPQAARQVGEAWARDALGFAQVTVATARLQTLLTELEFASGGIPTNSDPRHDMLLISRETEQHTLGCFVLAAQLRRRGVIVETLCGVPDPLIKARILTDGYSAVIFSCSRRQDLDSIGEIAMDSKRRMRQPPPFILGGIVLNAGEQVRRPPGIDLATSDLEEVLEYCAERSTRPQKQAAR